MNLAKKTWYQYKFLFYILSNLIAPQMLEIEPNSSDRVIGIASYGHACSSASYEDTPEFQQRNTGLKIIGRIISIVVVLEYYDGVLLLRQITEKIYKLWIDNPDALGNFRNIRDMLQGYTRGMWTDELYSYGGFNDINIDNINQIIENNTKYNEEFTNLPDEFIEDRDHLKRKLSFKPSRVAYKISIIYTNLIFHVTYDQFAGHLQQLDQDFMKQPFDNQKNLCIVEIVTCHDELQPLCLLKSNLIIFLEKKIHQAHKVHKHARIDISTQPTII
jgi:hypothetical protein